MAAEVNSIKEGGSFKDFFMSRNQQPFGKVLKCLNAEVKLLFIGLLKSKANTRTRFPV